MKRGASVVPILHTVTWKCLLIMWLTDPLCWFGIFAMTVTNIHYLNLWVVSQPVSAEAETWFFAALLPLHTRRMCTVALFHPLSCLLMLCVDSCPSKSRPRNHCLFYDVFLFFCHLQKHNPKKNQAVSVAVTNCLPSKSSLLYNTSHAPVVETLEPTIAWG